MSSIERMCSCVICKEVYTFKGIGSHYKRKHIEKQSNYNFKGLLKGIEAQKAKKELRIVQYNKMPSLCLHCSSPLSYAKRKNKYCNASCSVLHTHRGRKHSLETIRKISSTAQKSKIIYTKIKQCVICGYYHPWSGKTCSERCLHILRSESCSESLSKRDRRNYGRHQKSWLESSFEDWLLKNNFFDYRTEIKFYNHILNKTYFVDFLFEELKLIIELDGSQHEKTKEQDAIRDSFIEDHFGFKVLRITHKEYISKSKIELVSNLLGIEAGCSIH